MSELTDRDLCAAAYALHDGYPMPFLTEVGKSGPEDEGRDFWWVHYIYSGPAPHDDTRTVMLWGDGVANDWAVVAPSLKVAALWLDVLTAYVRHDLTFGECPLIEQAETY